MSPAEPSSWESTRRYLLVRSILERQGFSKCPEPLTSQEAGRGAGTISQDAPLAPFSGPGPCYVESGQPWDQQTGVIFTPAEASARKTWHILKELILYDTYPAESSSGGCYFDLTENDPVTLEKMISRLFLLREKRQWPQEVIYWLEGDTSNHPGLSPVPKRPCP